MADWITDDNALTGYITAMSNLVLGAYMMPDTTVFKKYTYKDYVKEALRISNAFFVDAATKMNPNMNYG